MDFLSSYYERLWPIWLHVVSVQVSLFLMGVAFYTLLTWRTWCSEFRDVKYERWQEKCPSNSHRPPPTRPEDENNNLIQAAARKRRPSIIDKICNNQKIARKSPELLDRGRASPVILKSGPSGPVYLSPRVHRNSEQDMDHIRIKFLDYLWVSFFVGPNVMFLWVTGILWLLVRQTLHRRGWLSPKACDPRQVVGRLVLESMQVMLFSCERKQRGDRIATFCWPNFLILREDGSMKVMDLLTVDINLTTKLMTKAMIDHKSLTPNEAIILIYFSTILVDQ